MPGHLHDVCGVCGRVREDVPRVAIRAPLRAVVLLSHCTGCLEQWGWAERYLALDGAPA